MTRGFSFVAYGLDLNNEVFGFYQGSPQYMIQREILSPDGCCGSPLVFGGRIGSRCDQIRGVR